MADHARSIPDVMPAEVASDNPVVVSQFFAERVPVAPLAPRFPEARLLDRRLCLINGERSQLFDRLNRDKAVPDSSDQRIITGIAYWLKWSKVRLGIIVNDEDVRNQVDLKRPDQNRIQLVMHVQL